LALQDSTVETYLKRAGIKLGIAGRNGLTRWMFDEPTAAPGSQQTIVTRRIEA
jgi:hypothetical protein